MPAALEKDVEIPEKFDYLFDPPLGEVRYRVAHGGRGSAKSWQFARALLMLGAQRKLRILCVREFQTSIADSVHKLLDDQIDFLGLRSFYDVEQKTIVGANGTEFIFKGLRRNIQSIKSTEGIDICWVEEAEAVSDTSWRFLIPTVRKPGSEIWVSFNPALETDPTYKRFVLDPPPRAIVRQVLYSDNPFLPAVLEEEKEHMRITDFEAFENVWGGQPWTRSDAEVLSGKWKVMDFVPQSHWLGPYYGADWGFAMDPTAIVKLWIADKRLYVEYDEHGIRLSIDDTERAFEKVPGAKEHVIRADSARPETINEMVLRKWRVQAAPKWDGSVKDGIEHLRSYESIIIHPRCKLAQRQARLWRYKTDPRTGDVLPLLMPSNDDTWDAARYGLSPMIRRRSQNFTPASEASFTG